MNILEKAAQARTRLAYRHVFWGYIALHIRFVEDPALGYAAATDCHRTIFLNPEGLAQYTDSHFTGIMGHELAHIVLSHNDQREFLNKARWDLACEYAANKLVIEDMRLTLPPGCFYDAKYSKLSTREIYNALPETPPAGKSFDAIVAPKAGPGGENAPTRDAIRQDARDIVAQAYELWKRSPESGRGTISAGLELQIRKIIVPKIPFERILGSHVSSAVGDRQEYERHPVHRKWAMTGAVLPRIRNFGHGPVVLNIDTSGSIAFNTPTLERFAGAIKALSSIVDELTVITSDNAVTEIVRPNHIPTFLKKLAFKGAGGTSHVPVFEAIAGMKEQPTLFIGLTDGYSEYPNKPPPYPVVWCLTPTHQTPPWGRSVVIDN